MFNDNWEPGGLVNKIFGSLSELRKLEYMRDN